jgi:DNA-directed RNA polymerase specialized sigma24 family protein
MQSMSTLGEPAERLDWDDVPRLRPRVVASVIRRGYTFEFAEEGCDRALKELYEMACRGDTVLVPWWFQRALWRAADARRECERELQAAGERALLVEVDDPEQIALLQLRADAIRSTLQREAPTDWAVLHMRAVRGLREKEVAERLGLTPKQVEHAYRRARDRAARFGGAVTAVLGTRRLGWRVLRRMSVYAGSAAAVTAVVLHVPWTGAPTASTGASVQRAAVVARPEPAVSPGLVAIVGAPTETVAVLAPWTPRDRNRARPTDRRTVVNVVVGTPATVSGGGAVQHVPTGRSLSEEVLYCIAQGLAVDLHHAGCPE